MEGTRRKLKSEYISYSQTMQDVFALMVNDFKFNGVCLDIGSSSPYEMFSNSLLLQMCNWKTICVDLEEHSESWKSFPNAKFYSMDFTKKENVEFILSQLPNVVDFLSLDIDDFTIDGLKLIDFTKVKFKCICIEHNKYLGNRGIQRHEQRQILEAAGYTMVVKNLHNYEDWWINGSLVNVSKFKYLEKYSNPTYGYPRDYLFFDKFSIDSFSPNHLSFIENNKSEFNKDTINSLKK